MIMKFSMYTFTTKEEAREWLLENKFSYLPDSLGMWVTIEGETVQAFHNANRTWTVEKWFEPNKANYILG